jgi:hypothetical protein
MMEYVGCSFIHFWNFLLQFREAQHNDSQHNDSQHNDNMHNGIQHKKNKMPNSAQHFVECRVR